MFLNKILEWYNSNITRSKYIVCKPNIMIKSIFIQRQCNLVVRRLPPILVFRYLRWLQMSMRGHIYVLCNKYMFLLLTECTTASPIIMIQIVHKVLRIKTYFSRDA